MAADGITHDIIHRVFNNINSDTKHNFKVMPYLDFCNIQLLFYIFSKNFPPFFKNYNIKMQNVWICTDRD